MGSCHKKSKEEEGFRKSSTGQKDDTT